MWIVYLLVITTRRLQLLEPAHCREKQAPSPSGRRPYSTTSVIPPYTSYVHRLLIITADRCGQSLWSGRPLRLLQPAA